MILTTGNADGLLSAALYLRFHPHISVNDVFFYTHHTIETKLDELMLLNKKTTIILLNSNLIPITKKLNALVKQHDIYVFTNKPFERNKLCMRIRVDVSEKKSTTQIIFDHFEESIKWGSSEVYLVELSKVASHIVSFQDANKYIVDDAVALTTSLSLDPLDNSFRTRVIFKLRKQFLIRQIAEVRERHVKAKYVTSKLIDMAYLYKIKELEDFILYEFNEDDTITVHDEDYRVQGRFSYLGARLAIIHKKVCVILVHVPQEDRCYIVLRKHGLITIRLPDLAKHVINLLVGSFNIPQADISYVGFDLATTINITKNLDAKSLISILQQINLTLLVK